MTRTQPKAAPTAREQIYAGPWKITEDVYGHKCQLCEGYIFSKREAYCRSGDDLSPAVYRHDKCHQEYVKKCRA